MFMKSSWVKVVVYDYTGEAKMCKLYTGGLTKELKNSLGITAEYLKFMQKEMILGNALDNEGAVDLENTESFFRDFDDLKGSYNSLVKYISYTSDYSHLRKLDTLRTKIIILSKKDLEIKAIKNYREGLLSIETSDAKSKYLLKKT